MSDITQRGALTKDDNFVPVGWKYNYQTGTGTVVVKAGAGVLHTITFNAPVAGSVITLYDSATNASSAFGAITVPSSPVPVSLEYDVSFVNGLTVNISTSVNLTISYI